MVDPVLSKKDGILLPNCLNYKKLSTKYLNFQSKNWFIFHNKNKFFDKLDQDR